LQDRCLRSYDVSVGKTLARVRWGQRHKASIPRAFASHPRSSFCEQPDWTGRSVELFICKQDSKIVSWPLTAQRFFISVCNGHKTRFTRCTTLPSAPRGKRAVPG
jgi:hypothetical protein